MISPTNRLVSLVAEQTSLPAEQIEKDLIHLEHLPVGEIEYKLADYYDEAARIMVSYVAILRHIRDLTRDSIPLDDPLARQILDNEEVRLKAMVQKMDAVEQKVKIFSEELREKAGPMMSVRLAQVDRCMDGLFVLRFREVDPSSPIGLSYYDSVLIYVDTTPGRTGALAFVYSVPRGKP